MKRAVILVVGIGGNSRLVRPRGEAVLASTRRVSRRRRDLDDERSGIEFDEVVNSLCRSRRGSQFRRTGRIVKVDDDVADAEFVRPLDTIVVDVVPDEVAERYERLIEEADVERVIRLATEARGNIHHRIRADYGRIRIACIGVGTRVRVGGRELLLREARLSEIDTQLVLRVLQQVQADDFARRRDSRNRREVVIAIRVGRGRSERHVRSAKQFDLHACQWGFPCVLDAILVGVVPDVIADFDRRRCGHRDQIADAVRFGERRVRVWDWREVQLVTSRNATRGRIEPTHSARVDRTRNPHGIKRSGCKFAKARNLQDAANSDFVVLGLYANRRLARIARQFVLEIKLATARTLARILRAGAERAVRVPAIRFERPTRQCRRWIDLGGVEIAIGVDECAKRIASRHPEECKVVRLRRIVGRESTELIAGAVANTERDVAIRIERESRQHRLRVARTADGLRLFGDRTKGRRPGVPFGGVGWSDPVREVTVLIATHVNDAALVVERDLEHRFGRRRLTRDVDKRALRRIEREHVRLQILASLARFRRVDGTDVNEATVILHRKRSQVAERIRSGAPRHAGRKRQIEALHGRAVQRTRCRHRV